MKTKMTWKQIPICVVLSLFFLPSCKYVGDKAGLNENTLRFESNIDGVEMYHLCTAGLHDGKVTYDTTHIVQDGEVMRKVPMGCYGKQTFVIKAASFTYDKLGIFKTDHKETFDYHIACREEQDAIYIEYRVSSADKGEVMHVQDTLWIETERKQEEQINQRDALGRRQGLWQDTLANRRIARGYYRNDTLHGDYTLTTLAAQPLIKGAYAAGREAGLWEYFTAQGIRYMDLRQISPNDSVLVTRGGSRYAPAKLAQVRLYDHCSGVLQEGGVLGYTEEPEMDTSVEIGMWYDYTPEGEVRDSTYYPYVLRD